MNPKTYKVNNGWTHRLEETKIAAVGVRAAVAVQGGELSKLLRRAVNLAPVAFQDFDGLLLRAGDFRLQISTP